MVLVCGPNGAGKSTLVYGVRKEDENTIPFIDPDRIAKEQQCSSIKAGEIAIASVRKHIASKESFIWESTLSSKFDFQMINEAKEKGFMVTLHYVGLQSADSAVARVKERHAKGGHFVPEEDVRRRYKRSLENLPRAIKLVDSAKITDNSGADCRVVAAFEKGKPVPYDFMPGWFQKIFDKLRSQSQIDQKKGKEK